MSFSSQRCERKNSQQNVWTGRANLVAPGGPVLYFYWNRGSLPYCLARLGTAATGSAHHFPHHKNPQHHAPERETAAWPSLSITKIRKNSSNMSRKAGSQTGIRPIFPAR